MPRHNFSAKVIGACKVDGCVKPNFRRGYCAMHYSRLLRHGSILEQDLAKAANGKPLAWVRDNVRHVGDGCLIYPYAKGRAGKVTVYGVRRSAVEVMCELAHGSKPSPEYEVAHNCGKGHLGCIHPDHIRWSTHTDNLADRIGHGTANRGERHGLSRFTVDEVLDIKASLSKGETQSSIASRHLTSQGTISKIARGERWGWLNAQT